MPLSYFFFDTYVGDFLQVLPVALAVAVLYGLLRRQKLLRSGSGWSLRHELPGILLVCYLVGLLALVATPSNLWTEVWYRLFYGQSSGNSLPLFQGVYDFIPTLHLDFSGENLGNILLFIPFGLLYPWAKGAGWRRTLAGGFLLSLVIEVWQPVVSRSFDINDLILNSAGAAIGWLLFLALRPLLRRIA